MSLNLSAYHSNFTQWNNCFGYFIILIDCIVQINKNLFILKLVYLMQFYYFLKYSALALFSLKVRVIETRKHDSPPISQ